MGTRTVSATLASKTSGEPPCQTAMQDPRKQYPALPFPEQKQSAPGVAGAMNPKPDHGETSYQGSGKFKGRKALITGGNSGIGRAAAIAYAREGADVAIGYLPSEEADAREVIALIEAEGRKGVALPGDVKDETWCRQLVSKTVEQLGGLDILVINAARQQFRETVAEVTTEDFDATLKTNLYALHWIAQAAVPICHPARQLSPPHQYKPTIPHPSCSTMPHRKPASSHTPRRCLRN